MSLSGSKSDLISALTGIYSYISTVKSSAELADRKSKAIMKFFLSGKPETVISFASPATGTGIGGIDKSSPGMGLAAAMPILQSQYIEIWTHHNQASAAVTFATKETEALYTFFTSAMVMTIDSGGLDPISMSGGSMGIGGTLAPAPGMGLTAAQPILAAQYTTIWSALSPKEVSAAKEALAIFNFATQAIVNTTGVIGGGSGMSVSGSLS